MHAGIEVDSVDEVGTAKRIRLGTAKWILAGTAKRILNKPPV